MEPIQSQVENVLDAGDMDTKHSDSSSRRGNENIGQISDQTDRQKPKLQKTRRLSSGGMVRAQKKRRARRANTAPDLHSMAANGPAVEDKRKAAKPGDEAEDSPTQLLNQTPGVVNRTAENEGFDRETALDETQSSMADHSTPSRAESTVTATWLAPSLTDEFYASEIGRNQNNSERDATNFCSSDVNQPSIESGSAMANDLLSPGAQSTSEAQTVDTSQELQSEGLAELKMATVDISADCDIVPPNKSKVHQSDLNREEIMVLSASARRRWSLPTTLDHFETSLLCIDATNGECKRHDSSLRRADSQIGTRTTPRKRSISLPNNFVAEKSDDFWGPPRLPATKVTNDLQCTDNSFDHEKTIPVTLLFEKNRTKVGRSKSWPSTLIYLEVSSEKSNSQRNDDLFRSKSLSSLENVVNTKFIEERLTIAHADANPVSKVAEKTEQIEDKEVTTAGETRSRQHSKGKSRSESFTFSKEKHIIDELNGSSFHQVSNTNKLCLRRSKSLPSVLSGSSQASTMFREIPHSSREIDLAETAPNVGEVGAAGSGCTVHLGECHMGATTTTMNPSHTSPIKQASETNGIIEHHTTTFESQEGLSESEQERHTISAMESQISMGAEEAGVHARSEESPTSQESHARETEDHLPSHANEVTERLAKSLSDNCAISDDHDTRHTHGAAEPHQGTQESHPSHASEIEDHARAPESQGAQADGKNEHRTETPKFQPSSEDNSGNAESLKTHIHELFKLQSGLTESEPSHGDETQGQSRDLVSQPSHENETSEFYKRTWESKSGCEITEGQTLATEAELLYYGDNTTELCTKTPGARENQANEGTELPSEISVSQLKRASETDNTSGTPESSYASEATAPHPGTSESQQSYATGIGDHSKYLEEKQAAESQPIQVDEATEDHSGRPAQEPSYKHENEDHTSKAESTLSHLNGTTEHQAGTAEPQMSHESEITEDHTSTSDSTPSHANDTREHQAVTTETQMIHESEITEDHTSTPDSTPSNANDTREHHAVTTEPQMSHQSEIAEGHTSTPDSTPSHANDAREHHAVTTEPQMSHESEITEDHTSSPDSTPSHANDTREHHAVTTEPQMSHESEIAEDHTSTPDSTPSHANDAREHHAVTTELQMSHESEIVEDHTSTPDSTPSHANDAREHYAVTTEPQMSHDDKTTEDHTRTSDSTPSQANDTTKHHMVTINPQLSYDNEITEYIASKPQSLPGDVNGIEDPSRTLSESQPSLAANASKENIRTLGLSQCSDRATKHEDQPELECGSVTGLTKYSRRRPRSFTLPYTMESIVEVPNEQAEEADSGTTNPSYGLELTQAYKRGCRSHTLGSIGRSHSVDFANFRQDSDAPTPDHGPDTCTSELEEKLMLGADGIEVTLTDVFDADATSRDSRNEQISGGADREENFDLSISKFDSILSSVVSSFLEPDYASSSSSLHRAVAKGDLGKVKRLIERGANVDAYDEHGLPALHVAVVSGDYDMAECLLEAGADLRVYTETLIQEYTTLKQQVYYNL